jgi:hypothetical protein
MYLPMTLVTPTKRRMGLSIWLVPSISDFASRADDQDADFEGEEPSSKKRKKDKGKKDKKGKNKAVEEEEAQVEDENLTVAEKAKKVKKAMEEYKALDHEDMVSALNRPQANANSDRSATCQLDSSTRARNPPHSV